MKPGTEFQAFKNCHVEGLYSIPLYQSDKYVERMFIDTLGNTKLVAPHNHRYDLLLRVTSGVINHTIWEPDPMGSIEMHHFDWKSPIDNGGLGEFVYREESARYRVTSQDMYMDSCVEMKHDQIHSLVTEPGTSWIVTEELDNPDAAPVTLWYTPHYHPMLYGLYYPI